MSDSEEDWKFEVSSKDVARSSLKKRRNSHKGHVPEVTKTKRDIGKKKKIKESNIVLDFDKLPDRRSRKSVARELELDKSYTKAYVAPLFSRLKAFIVDVALLLLLAFCAILMKDMVYEYYIATLTYLNLNQNLHPKDLDKVLFLIAFSTLYFLFAIFPTIIWGSTLGMKFWKLTIGHESPKIQVGYSQLFTRQILAPISILTGIGVLMGFKNKRRQFLHDKITKTCVYKEIG